MGDMILRRPNGGAIITTHFENWKGWDAKWAQPIIPTVLGVLYFQKTSVRNYSAQCTLLFGQGWPDGSIDNVEVLRDLAHDLVQMDFTDKEGWTRPVICHIPEENETIEEVVTKSIYRVPVTLYRPGYIE